MDKKEYSRNYYLNNRKKLIEYQKQYVNKEHNKKKVIDYNKKKSNHYHSKTYGYIKEYPKPIQLEKGNFSIEL